MYRAIIVTPRSGDGLTTLTAYACQAASDYPFSQWQDITGQANVPSVPNVYTVVAVLDDATLAAIQADPTYVVLTAVPA